MKTKRMSLDDFKKKVQTNSETLGYAKGGIKINIMCRPSPIQDKCHPKSN